MISPIRILKGIAIIWISLFGSFTLAAQSFGKSTPVNSSFALNNVPSEVQPLSIGDKVPDIIFDNVFNYKSKKANLSDLKGKLTILDFWSTSCKSCIEFFPHLQLLQNEFKNNLQIILVNGKTRLWRDNEEKAKRLLDRLKERTGSNIQMPMVFNSLELDTCFPWTTIPHEVWINDKGIVIAITGPDEVNSKNIQAILNGKKVGMRQKEDISIDLNKHSLSELIYGQKPLLSQPVFSSILVKGYLQGINAHGVIRYDSSNAFCVGWYSCNESLLGLYKAIFRSINFPPDNLIVIEMRDSSILWKVFGRNYDNLYSYDITVPPRSFGDLLKNVQMDFEQKFRTRILKERRKMKCELIKVSPQLVKSYTKGGEKEWQTETYSFRKYIHNYPISEILKELNNFSTIPLINETGLTKNIDMELPFDLHNTAAIIQALKNAGFEVIEEERELEVTVITDKSN